MLSIFSASEMPLVSTHMRALLTELSDCIQWCVVTVLVICVGAVLRGTTLSSFHWSLLLPMALPICLLLLMLCVARARPYIRLAMCISHILYAAWVTWYMESTLTILNQQLQQDMSQYLQESNCACTFEDVLARLPGSWGLLMFFPCFAAQLVPGVFLATYGIIINAVVFFITGLFFIAVSIFSSQVAVKDRGY